MPLQDFSFPASRSNSNPIDSFSTPLSLFLCCVSPPPFMAFNPTGVLFFFFIATVVISIPILGMSQASIVEELNQQPPTDFGTTISNNCQRDPSLRYCNFSTTDLPNIFKSTIVAIHLCNESKNLNCSDSFKIIDLHARPKVAPLYMSFSFFWKYCPPTVQTINLANNSLGGHFPSDILHCTQIQALDLSHNELVGELPLEALSLLTNLTFLNLSYNRFSGSSSNIADNVGFFKRFNTTSFLHSGLGDHHPGLKVTAAVLLLIGVLASVILAVGFFGWLFVRRPDYLPSFLQRRHKFTPAMLKAATNGFSEDKLVSRSERSEVYRGKMRDGTQVDIKIHRGKVSAESRRAFTEECHTLVQLNHKSLIKVLGWSNKRELRAVVTEGIDAISVEEWLLRSPTWKQRLKVLKGVVEGMCYLFEQWPQVGYDLRTDSVVLSDNLEPLISKLRIGNQNSESRKAYKFGIFLLELVVNKRPREEFERGDSEFVDWMRMHYPKNVQKVVDKKMKVTSSTYEQMKQVIGLGLACTDLSTTHPLSITEISVMLHRICGFSSIQTEPTRQRPPHKDGKGEDGHMQSKS